MDISGADDRRGLARRRSDLSPGENQARRARRPLLRYLHIGLDRKAQGRPPQLSLERNADRTIRLPFQSRVRAQWPSFLLDGTLVGLELWAPQLHARARRPVLSPWDFPRPDDVQVRHLQASEHGGTASVPRRALAIIEARAQGFPVAASYRFGRRHAAQGARGKCPEHDLQQAHQLLRFVRSRRRGGRPRGATRSRTGRSRFHHSGRERGYRRSFQPNAAFRRRRNFADSQRARSARIYRT